MGVTEASADDIHRIATALRGSGLRALPAAVRIDAVVSLAQEFREFVDEADVWPLAESSGLSMEMTRWALRTTFEGVTPSALTAFLSDAEIPGHHTVPVTLAATLLSSNVLTSPARALLLPLLIGVPVLARVSSREQAFATLLHDRLSHGCASMQAISRGLALVTIRPETPSGAHAFQALLSEADVVSVYGSDHTCTEVRRKLPPGVQGIEHGHGLGVGVLAAGANTDDEAVDALAAEFALDVAAYDQRGCLSPQVLYVQEGGWVSPQRFAERLHAALGQKAVTLPRGPIDPQLGAQQLQYRGVGAALGRLFEGDGWAVTYEGELPARPTPGYRNIAVHGYAGDAALMTKLTAFGRHLKVVGYAGSEEARQRFANNLPPHVAPRVCALGEMQTPPFTCVWDGLPAWHGLVRYVAR